MAANDKDPDQNPEADTPDTEEQLFVDRDDDSYDGFIDRDYDDDHPGEPAAQSDVDPDPGYAAFAADLEDPLADWPSPEASLEDLPEMRMQEEVDDLSGDELPADEAEAPIADNDDIEEVFAAPPPADLAFGDNDDEADPMAPDQVDIDRSFTAPVTEEPAPEELPAAVFDVPDTSEPGGFPELDEAPEAPEEDEFVDDFLNDLDPPEEEQGDITASFDEMPGTNSLDDPEPASVDGGNSVEMTGASMLEAVDEEPDPVPQETPKPGPRESTAAKPEQEGRSLPLGMIAIVILALCLLGVGGYGVVQQRSGLEAEIRDLRAQLATTMTADEAAAERESQRQIELNNESLNAEVEALTAENAELGNQLRALEVQLTERAAEAEAAAKAAEERAAASRREAEEAARQAKAAPAPTPVPAPKASSALAGPWFVNFGSYAQKNVADRWAAELKVNEGEVRVQTATAAGKSLYRVRVVGLASQDQAERVATALERQYQLPRLWVGKN